MSGSQTVQPSASQTASMRLWPSPVYRFLLQWYVTLDPSRSPTLADVSTRWMVAWLPAGGGGHTGGEEGRHSQVTRRRARPADTPVRHGRSGTGWTERSAPKCGHTRHFQTHVLSTLKQ